MRSFFVWLFLPFVIFAQFTKDDEALIKTMFRKKYDKEIISSYLHSPSPQKIKAALLCLGSNDDTSFAAEIAKPDFNKYGDLITFALGQAGRCTFSSQFLANKIYSKNFKFRKQCLEAFGKTASAQMQDSLIAYYFSNKNEDWNGISLGLLNFFTGNIKSAATTEKIFKLLSNEFSSKKASPVRITDALFTFYRLGGEKSYKEDLLKLTVRFPKLNLSVKQHLLACLRRINYFPTDFNLYKKLSNDPNWLIRQEASKLLVFYPHFKMDEINEYLKFINDKNPNVSRQAATSIQALNVADNIKPEFKKSLLSFLDSSTLPANTQGELLKSIIKMFPTDYMTLLGNYRNKTRRDFVFDIIGNNYKTIPNAFDTLLSYYKHSNLKDRISLANIILSFEDNYIKMEAYSEFVFNGMNSNEAAIVSTISDGIKDTFITINTERIKSIIEKQVSANYNSPDFYEGTISLANIAKKISDYFYKNILSELTKSNVYSIKKYAASANNAKTPIEKEDEIFQQIIKNAFKYKGAKIYTEKGNIEIEFLNGFSPVSVGNFCYLASHRFYDNNIFHRVVPGFVIQGGDPTQTGFGGPGHEITTEPSPFSYKTGAVGMASAGKDTEGSQWFIMQGYHPHLNSRYSLFAQVKNGLNAVFNIDQDDRILKIELLP